MFPYSQVVWFRVPLAFGLGAGRGEGEGACLWAGARWGRLFIVVGLSPRPIYPLFKFVFAEQLVE